MKTADPELMRAINRFHVMDAIRQRGPISRVELVQQTDLSPTTVSAITAALLDDELIAARRVAPPGDAGRGRPRVMLELNPEAAFVVGVKLAPHQISVATTNFRADVLKSLTLPVRTTRQPASVIADIVEDGVRHCVADAGLTLERIGGVCVGLPGLIEHDTAICRASPIFAETDVALAAAVRDRLGVEVTLDSDVNLATLAEHWFGHGRGLSDFAVVAVEHSLGLGIMHAGELMRGADGLSADFGDLIVWPEGPAKGGAAPTRLNDCAGAAAVLAEIERVAPGRLPPDTGGVSRLRRAAEAAEAGDAALADVFARAGRALGLAIANVITLLAPRTLIIAGSAVGAGDALLRPLRATVEQATPPVLRDAVDIISHDWSDDMWARGAAALTLRRLYGAPWSTSGPARLPHAATMKGGGEKLAKTTQAAAAAK